MNDMIRPHMVFNSLSIHVDTWNIFEEWLIENNNGMLPKKPYIGISSGTYYDISHMLGRPRLLVKQLPLTEILRISGIFYLKLLPIDNHDGRDFGVSEVEHMRMDMITLDNFNEISMAFWETLNEQNK